ncbi:chaplin family protein [Streptomyces sp. NPDC049597]|uniref:chaplin n=1 Tax=Streptomyces sp. NPDC049597 TaxID=3155276 RepID=UPI00344102BC
MRQVTRKGLISVAAAGGVLALGGGYAQADSVATGGASNSPGVLSGNSIQAPVHVPVNLCGNTVDVIGLLNPAMGTTCANVSGGGAGQGSQAGGSQASGTVSDSPGIASGNQVQVPVDVPLDVCGNTVTVIGALNPSTANCGNGSTPAEPGNPQEPSEPGNPQEPAEPGNPQEPSEPGNPQEPAEPGNPQQPTEPGSPQQPGTPETPPAPATPSTPSTPEAPNAPGARAVAPQGAQLAETGMDALDVLAPAGVGLLLAGAVLYRRARTSA